jgi:glycosyltransferase involved in cell wall biosynthesis
MTKKKPKICFVSPKIYPILVRDDKVELVGGAEVQQSIIVKELDKRGYDISVITMDYGQNNLVKIGNNIKIYKASKENDGIRFIRSFHPFSTSIWKLMKKIDADIYYQRIASMLTGIVAYFCKKHNKIFIFSLAHDKDAVCEMTAEHNIISLFREKTIYRYGLTNADVVICQNQFQKNMLKKIFNINGRLIKSTYQKDKVKTINHKNILWVGKIIKWKRPEIFVNISKALPEYQFVLVGGAKHDNDINNLKRYANNKNIYLKGFVPYHNIDKYFDESVIFINTSRSEGFPNTFLQAWSRGIPVISSVDPSNIIKKNKLGFVCKSESEFIKRIIFLIKNKKEYVKISKSCRHYFEKNHSVEKIIDDYEKILKRQEKRK